MTTAGATDANVAFVGTPAVRELLQQREAVATSGRFIWDGDRVANRRAYATPDAATASLIAGDFAQVLVGLWGPGLEFMVNPVQDFPKGICAARVMLTADCTVLQPGAFVKATSIT